MSVKLPPDIADRSVPSLRSMGLWRVQIRLKCLASWEGRTPTADLPQAPHFCTNHRTPERTSLIFLTPSRIGQVEMESL